MAKATLNQHRKKLPTYEQIVWGLWTVITFISVLDRFTFNVWPRQWFRTFGEKSAGTDRIDGFVPGPWSVVFYDVMARFTGRFSIAALNLMIMTRCIVLEQIIATSWIRHYVDLSNIVKANLRAHIVMGIFLCVATLIHVWSILLPCMTDGYSANIILGTFEWPLSERAPDSFQDANIEEKFVSLEYDDVYRLISMTIFLGILAPLSIYWMDQCWHLGIHAHRFMAVVYFLDICRRHTHPHCWILNFPIGIYWCVDKIIGVTWRRSKVEPFRQNLSNQYIVLYWNDNSKTNDVMKYSVGKNYHMRLTKSSILESVHTFTSFQHVPGVCPHDDFVWTNGAVIRVFDNTRKPPLGGRKEFHSHTRRMANEEPKDVTVWGPLQGSVSEMVTRSLLRIPKEGEKPRSVVMIGSGSAINYLIDGLLLLATEGFREKTDKYPLNVVFLYSTRDKELYKWVTNTMIILMQHLDANNSRKNKFVEIVLACTVKESFDSVIELNEMGIIKKVDEHADANDHLVYDNEGYVTSDDEDYHDVQTQTSPENLTAVTTDISKTGVASADFETGVCKFMNHRIRYTDIISTPSDVFCQGSSPFCAAIEKTCKKKRGVTLFLD